MAFGEILKRERERRGLSLDQVAAATKVASRHLAAIENDDFGELPGGIFRRSFVRSYARFLQLDEDEVVQKYLAASGDELGPGPLPVPPPDAPHARFSSRRIVTVTAICVIAAAASIGGYRLYLQQQLTRAYSTARISSAVPSAPVPHHGSAGAAASAAQPADVSSQSKPTPAMPENSAVTLPGNLTATESSHSVTTNASAQAPSVHAPAANSAGTQASATDVQQTAPQGIVLEVRVTRPAWVSMMADGLLLWETTMHPGERRTVTANESVRVITGNAGATELTLNGEPMGHLGPLGTVARFAYPQSAVSEPRTRRAAWQRRNLDQLTPKSQDISEPANQTPPESAPLAQVPPRP